MDFYRYTKGKSPHKFVYTTSTIAKATNLQPDTIRKYIYLGKLDMNDLVSVAKFIMRHVK